MNGIKDLKAHYFVWFAFTVALNIMIIAGIVLLAKNMGNWEQLDEQAASILRYILIIGLSITETYLLFLLITLLKDLKSVRKNTFEEITGTVIRYARNKADDGRQLNNYPIIQKINSAITIKLLVNKGTAIKGTYTFVYLKHTKIGAVKSKQTNNNK